LYVSLAPALLAAVLSLTIRSGEPPTPSCLSSTDVKVPYKLLLKSKSYLILFGTVGLGLSNNNTLSTLLQQIMCPFGYDDISVGLCIGSFILCGLTGCIIFGYIADRTKKLEEVTKIEYTLGVVSLMILGLFIINGVPSYLLYIIFGLSGFAMAPVLPLSLDLCLECTHPIPEATVVGIFLIASQIGSIISILILPFFTRSLSSFQEAHQKCASLHQEIRDYTIPLYILAIISAVFVILFIIFFKSENRRQRKDDESSSHTTALNNNE
ncbi:unnamed protein product, partial [Didymodactylos carnosus]